MYVSSSLIYLDVCDGTLPDLPPLQDRCLPQVGKCYFNADNAKFITLCKQLSHGLFFSSFFFFHFLC